jgi:hypothetical protein
MAFTTPITTVKPSLYGGDGKDAGAVAAATLAAKRQKKAVKSEDYKVSNNLPPQKKRVLHSQRETSEGGSDILAGSPAKAAILSQEEDAFEGVMDGEEPSDKKGSVGGNPRAWADEGGYDNDINAKEGVGRLRHGMAKLEATMAVPGLTAAWFAEQVWSTTLGKMAASYEAVVRLIVDNQAGALATALEFEARKRTYLAVPNGEGFFLVFHGLTWWAEAPGGACNQQGYLVAFKGNVCSRQGVPNLWRFDKQHEALFRFVKLPLVALCDATMFYALDNNNNL